MMVSDVTYEASFDTRKKLHIQAINREVSARTRLASINRDDFVSGRQNGFYLVGYGPGDIDLRVRY
jgi:hypothetical protein